MTSSMHHDLERGGRLEVAWLSGDVVARRAEGKVAGHTGQPRRRRPARRARGRSRPMTERLTVRGVEPPPPSRITAAPLLLIDVLTEQGVTGRAYLFCYVESIGRRRPRSPVPRPRCWRGPRPTRRDGRAAARALPARRGDRTGGERGRGRRCRVLGRARDRRRPPAGAAVGRRAATDPRLQQQRPGPSAAPAVADEALELVAEGFRAVKMRLGRPAPADDVAAVRAVRSALPDDVTLMADFNQGLSLGEARSVPRAGRRGPRVDRGADRATTTTPATPA